MDVGDSYTCALLINGTVQCWGINNGDEFGNGTATSNVPPVPVSGISRVTNIAVGVWYACAVIDDSSVQCWGDNIDGQLGDETKTNRSVPVRGSGFQLCGAGGNRRVCRAVQLARGAHGQPEG